ncbi:MAG: hypothetical protein WCJ14_13435, partial [Verrucomicrobiota bacterium]
KILPTATKPVSGIPYWPSRDPIGEKGGVNLYGFVGNDGVNYIDVSGMYRDDAGNDLVGPPPPGDPTGAPNENGVPQCKKKCHDFWDAYAADINIKLEWAKWLAGSSMAVAASGGYTVAVSALTRAGIMTTGGGSILVMITSFQSEFKERVKAEHAKCDGLCPCKN